MGNGLVIAIISICLLTACTSAGENSMYPSGWNANVNESAYSTCGVVRFDRQILIRENIEVLRKRGLLTADEASRVVNAAVRVGDSECMAYASYGLGRSEITHTADRDGRTIEKSVKYLCAKSAAPCPGVIVSFRDGRVSDIQPIKDVQ